MLTHSRAACKLEAIKNCFSYLGHGAVERGEGDQQQQDISLWCQRGNQATTGSKGLTGYMRTKYRDMFLLLLFVVVVVVTVVIVLALSAAAATLRFYLPLSDSCRGRDSDRGSCI